MIKCPNCDYHLDKDLKYIPYGGYCPNCGVHLVMTRKAQALLIITTLATVFIVPTIFKGENIGRLMIWVSMGVVLILPMGLNRIFGFKALKNSIPILTAKSAKVKRMAGGKISIILRLIIRPSPNRN